MSEHVRGYIALTGVKNEASEELETLLDTLLESEER